MLGKQFHNSATNTKSLGTYNWFSLNILRLSIFKEDLHNIHKWGNVMFRLAYPCHCRTWRVTTGSEVEQFTPTLR